MNFSRDILRTKIRPAIGLSMLCLALGLTISAATTDAQKQQASQALNVAKSLINQRKFAKADEILSNIQVDFPDHPEILFQSAQIARARKDKIKAVALYKQLLQNHPDTARVQLELARTYFDMGEDTKAKTEFRKALKLDLPVTAKKKVRKFLARIRNRHPVSVSMPVSFTPSDNLNRATQAETIRLGSLEFALNDDARAREGFEFTLDPRVTLKIPSEGKFKPYIGQRFDLDLYSEGDLNTYGVGFFAGTKFKLDRFLIDAAGDYLHKRDEDQGLSDVLSSSLDIKIPVHINFVAGLDLGHALTNNLLNDSYDADTYSLGATGQIKTKNLRLHLGISGSKSDAESDAASFERLRYSAAIDATPKLPLSSKLSVAYEATNYDSGREDALYSVSLSTQLKSWSPFGFNPVLTVGHSKKNSTYVLGAYERTHGGLRFVRSF